MKKIHIWFIGVLLLVVGILIVGSIVQKKASESIPLGTLSGCLNNANGEEYENDWKASCKLAYPNDLRGYTIHCELPPDSKAQLEASRQASVKTCYDAYGQL